MITKAEKDTYVQKCVCGKKVTINYTDLIINKKYIKLPACSDCNSIEVLFLNEGKDDHSVLVSRVFAKVATSGE